MYSYFVFNGVDSRDMGIYLAAPAPIMRGKERLTDATVLGRAGTLTLAQGDDIYEPYTQQLIVRAREPIHEITKWLRGSGYVTFSGEPELRQLARVVQQAQFKKISHNLAYWEATVQFYCQPLKELIHESEYAYTSGAPLVNLGDVIERPVITLTGAYGNIEIAVGAEQGLRIEGLDSAYGGCVVDCGARELLSLDKSELLTRLTTGDFPALPVGRSAITFSGDHLGAVTIGRRQRWV